MSSSEGQLKLNRKQEAIADLIDKRDNLIVVTPVAMKEILADLVELFT